jgi:hypothetical protein
VRPSALWAGSEALKVFRMDAVSILIANRGKQEGCQAAWPVLRVAFGKAQPRFCCRDLSVLCIRLQEWPLAKLSPSGRLSIR